MSSAQLNIRLPQLAQDQIKWLASEFGLTKTQVVLLAVDRFARELQRESFEAKKDIRRLKTVARIAPDLDIGQEEKSG